MKKAKHDRLLEHAALPRAGGYWDRMPLSPVQRELAIQLSLDPGVRSVEYVVSLQLGKHRVPVEMLVGDVAAGRTAFDIVDDRPDRDIDGEGLLLIALRHHGIDLVERDRASILADPRASNCRRIWRHRDEPTDPSWSEALPRLFGRDRSLKIAELGRRMGLSRAFPTVCTLLCRRLLAVDLDSQLDGSSVVFFAGASEILDPGAEEVTDPHNEGHSE